TTGVILFYANYRFILEAYRPPYDSLNADNGNLTSGLCFMFLALNPFQLFQIIQPLRNCTLHPP
ncbi:hypothetical protein MKX08_003200, partial [Trichoderma sp. CBMAI-0020]